MALGTIRVRMLLNEPRRTHYGADDSITGRVGVTYRERDVDRVAELFAPLTVEATLSGKVCVSKEGFHDASYSRFSAGGRNLFSIKHKVHDGAVRLLPGKEQLLPFSINFPEHADVITTKTFSAEKNEDGRWKYLERASDERLEMLPPSMRSRLVWGGAMGEEICAMYDLCFQAAMTVDVKILEHNHAWPIIYDQPAVPSPTATMLIESAMGLNDFGLNFTVESRDLVPEDERPRGFRGKTKALFNSSEECPKQVFRMECSGLPRHLFVGQPVELRISVCTIDSESSSSVIPDVVLESCEISLLASTKIKHQHTTRQAYSVNAEEILTKKAAINPPGPFAESHSWTKSISVGVLREVPSTFNSGDASREYKLRLALRIKTVGKSMSVNRMFPVDVHPPVLVDDLGAAIPSRVQAEAEEVNDDLPPPPEDDEQLPTYEDAVGGVSGRT